VYVVLEHFTFDAGDEHHQNNKCILTFLCFSPDFHISKKVFKKYGEGTCTDEVDFFLRSQGFQQSFSTDLRKKKKKGVANDPWLSLVQQTNRNLRVTLSITLVLFKHKDNLLLLNF